MEPRGFRQWGGACSTPVAGMYRVITVAREFGSGGGPIAGKLAGRLGWRLLDNALVEHIAKAANVDSRLAERYDECVDPWLHRLVKHAFTKGAMDSVTAYTNRDLFDSELMAQIARRVILEAAGMGECVVVGRGSQCILGGRRDTFHVYVSGPWAERVRRVRERYPDARDVPEFIAEMDRKRAAYVHRYFGADWRDPHNYELMLNSAPGEERAVEAILCLTGLAAR